jgi:hypothetical protein
MKIPGLKTLLNPYRVTLSPASCSLDLGDGSERGEYVNQDYILSTLGRPHRSVNLMYCYYPFDKGWPQRASVAHQPKGDGTWPYPYDDYFPFSGGPKGNPQGEVFQQMRDIRRHGQDVTLTLTIDCAVPNDHIRVIARQLKPYGRLRLRLNHECDGVWFSFNRRYTYTEVAAFFVRLAGVFKKEAPNVQLMGCWGLVEDFKTGRLKHEDELSPILGAADIWSTDIYLSLHYGWPARGCEPGDQGKTYNQYSLKTIWRQYSGIHQRFCEITGKHKGLEIGELNADGDVGGEDFQAKQMRQFYGLVLRKKPAFLTGITYYQFRDRGRLGLEREDPNNIRNGVATPFLSEYRKLIQNPYFTPKETWSRRNKSLRMEWRASDNSDGLGWKVPLKKRPIFLELLLDKNANLMILAGNQCFYKKPGVEWVDVTTATSEWGRSKPFPIRLFAPPADGTNPGGASGVPARLSQPPQMRIRCDWKPRKSK